VDTQEQQTPLHISARLGSVEAVQLLLHHGATRDAATKDLYTPLHIAVKEGHEDVVEILLDSGAKHNTITRVCYVCVCVGLALHQGWKIGWEKPRFSALKVQFLAF